VGPRAPPTDQATTKNNVSNTYQDLKQIKTMANQRGTWLGQMIVAQAEAQNIPKKVMAKIHTMEASHKKASLVKEGALEQATPWTGLLSITPPPTSTNATQQEIHTRTNLEKACLDEAHQRFTQAVNIPFLQPPLIQLLGWTGIDSPAFDDILANTFTCPPGCNLYAKKLIQHLDFPPEVHDITN